MFRVLILMIFFALGFLTSKYCSSDLFEGIDDAPVPCNFPDKGVEVYPESNTDQCACMPGWKPVPDPIQLGVNNWNWTDSVKGVTIPRCERCPAGTINENHSTISWSEPNRKRLFNCNPCEEGNGPNEEQTKCIKCQPSQISVNNGKGWSCKTCEDGKKPDENNKECVECPSGMYGASGKCLACPPGKYQDETGQPSCKDCPPGKYQSAKGQQSCKDCPPMSYQNEKGQSGCKRCTVGSFNGQQTLFTKPFGAEYPARTMGIYRDVEHGNTKIPGLKGVSSPDKTYCVPCGPGGSPIKREGGHFIGRLMTCDFAGKLY